MGHFDPKSALRQVHLLKIGVFKMKNNWVLAFVLFSMVLVFGALLAGCDAFTPKYCPDGGSCSGYRDPQKETFTIVTSCSKSSCATNTAQYNSAKTKCDCSE
jgi:hypothetical protein